MEKRPTLHPTIRCASQTAPEAQRKRNIRNAESNYKPLKKEDMKTKIILWIGALLLLIGEAGCEKELSDTELMKQQIIGTWEWTVSYQPGILWEVKPIPGEKREITFIDDRVLATHNKEIIDNKPVITDNKKVILDGSYVLCKEKDKFYITITPKEGAEDLQYLVGKKEISLNEDGNTLIFSYYIGKGGFSTIYKKVN